MKLNGKTKTCTWCERERARSEERADSSTWSWCDSFPLSSWRLQEDSGDESNSKLDLDVELEHAGDEGVGVGDGVGVGLDEEKANNFQIQFHRKRNP